MKNFNILFFILIFLASGLILSSEVKLTERLGQIIDRDEREYFNLFPKINGFVSAELISDSKNNLSFNIISDSSESDSENYKNISPEIIDNLNIAVENFEVLNENRALKINWKLIISKYVLPSGRINPKTENISLLLTDGTIVSGLLLFADSLFLVISDDKLPYDWRNFPSNTKTIHYSLISEFSKPFNVDINQNFSLYNLNLEYYQNISMFNNKVELSLIPPPPEINSILKAAHIDYKTFSRENELSYEKILEKEAANDDMHLYIDYSPGTYFTSLSDLYLAETYLYWHSDGMFGGYWAEGIKYSETVQFDGLNQNSFSISTLFNLSPRFALGLVYADYPRKEPVWKQSSVSSDGYSLSLIASYTLAKRNFFSASYLSRFGINVYAGFLYGSIFNQVYIYFPDRESFLNLHNFTNELIGGTLGLNIDYYLFEFLSINANLLANILKSYDFTNKERIRGNLILSSKQNTINYSGFGLKFGLGFHL